jgi:hypothetical protein
MSDKNLVAPRLEYQHPDRGDDPRPDFLKHADKALMLWAKRVIDQHYPGHFWRIEADHAQGILKLQIPAFMGINWYVVPIDHLKTDPSMRAVVRGCGEILERYNIPRSGLRMDDFMGALEIIPKHQRGIYGKVPS